MCDQIDAVGGTVSMDFYLRLYWQDNRLSMPLFWEQMSPTVRKNGIDLTQYFAANPGNSFWLPDVRFHDAQNLNYLVQVSGQPYFYVNILRSYIDMYRVVCFSIGVLVVVIIYYCLFFVMFCYLLVSL